MASYSVQYIYRLNAAQAIREAKRLGKAAARMGSDIAGSGAAANSTQAAVTRMAKGHLKAARDTQKLGSASKTTSSAIGLIGRAAKATTGALHAMGAAASSAMAKASAAISKQRQIAAYNRGGAGMGYYERQARSYGSGPAFIKQMQDQDRAMRREYLAAQRGKGRSVGGRGSYSSGSMRILGAAGIGGRIGAGGGGGMLPALAGAAAGHSLVSRYASYEEAMIEAKAIGRRLSQSDEQMAKLFGQARSLGSSTMFEPQDILQGQLLFLKAGRSAEEAMVGIPHTLSLAAVAGVDVAKATETTLNLMAQGRIPAAQLSEVMDNLTATFLNSKSELAGLAKMANYAVPVLTNLGVPLEQQFAALGALAEGGQTAQGGRQLRQIMVSLQKIPFDKNKTKILKEAGISLDKYFTKGKLTDFRGLVEAIGQAQEMSQEAGDGGIIERLFPANAVTGMATLVAQLEAYDRILAAQPGFKGATAEIAAARFEGLIGATRQLSAAWSELGIAFSEGGTGAAIESAIRSLTGAINSMSESFKFGSFLEEMFDPAMIGGTFALFGSELQQAIVNGILEGVKAAMNGIYRALGLSTDGTAIDEVKRQFNEAAEKTQAEIRANLDARREAIRGEVTTRAPGIEGGIGRDKRVGFGFAARNMRSMYDVDPTSGMPKIAEDLLPSSKAAKAAAEEAARAGMMPSGAIIPAPTPHPNRIVEQQAQRVQVDTNVTVQDASVTVNMTGKIDVNGNVSGSAKVPLRANVDRGVSAPEAGQVSTPSSPIAP